ncbi:nucleotide exchange factor GrpE [Chelatococcus reniformis]|uniref:Protein GrpE n=1 Tax=Chelatococcus reniformis TaxID=1494448 RepID=A0A916UXV7_9HYPH|nr:nucleotide exchange factor GrpE [Chelatococcus reniformis]GGC93059.1 protein GrpE [Chelatococcus reniformis]
MNQKPNDHEAAGPDTVIQDTGVQPEPAAAAQREPGDVIEALAAENTELKDKVLRTLADMENLRRRTEREVGDAKTYGVSSFARDMLTVVDNIARALEAIPAEARGHADAPLKSFVEGIELTERDLIKTLERHGVKRISPQGERFDPHRHQAMFELPDTSVPNGTVVQVVQPGFVIGERVLRPALVGVSKGGAKPAPQPAGGEANTDEG